MSFQVPFFLGQVPKWNGTDPELVSACSVDARWTRGQIVGVDPTLTGHAKILYHREDLALKPPTKFLNVGDVPLELLFRPSNNESWRSVELDLNWLNTLTPDVSSPGYTTLADILNSSGIQSRGVLDSGHDWITRSAIEAVLATAVVDGMSRVGYWDQVTHGYWDEEQEFDANNPYINVTNEELNYFFDNHGGKSVVPFPQGASPDNVTRLEWSITTSGWGWQTNRVSAKLALIVLFTDGLIILCHMLYLYWPLFFSGKRRAFMRWGSFEDMIAISRTSAESKSVPEVFKNTSSGIQSRATRRTLVKLRSVRKDQALSNGEEVRLLFEGENEKAYEKIKVDESYGVTQ